MMKLNLKPKKDVVESIPFFLPISILVFLLTKII